MQKDEVTHAVTKRSLEEVLTDFFNRYPEVKNSVSYMKRKVFTREIIEFFIRTRIFDLMGALNLPGPSEPSRLCLKAALLYEKNFYPSVEQNPFMKGNYSMSDPIHVKAVEKELEASLRIAGVIVSVLLNNKIPREICYKILFQVEEDLGVIPLILWEDKIKLEKPVLNAQQKLASPKLLQYSQRNLLMNEMGRERIHHNQINKQIADHAARCIGAKRPDL